MKKSNDLAGLWVEFSKKTMLLREFHTRRKNNMRNAGKNFPSQFQFVLLYKAFIISRASCSNASAQL